MHLLATWRFLCNRVISKQPLKPAMCSHISRGQDPFLALWSRIAIYSTGITWCFLLWKRGHWFRTRSSLFWALGRWCFGGDKTQKSKWLFKVRNKCTFSREEAIHPWEEAINRCTKGYAAYCSHHSSSAFQKGSWQVQEMVSKGPCMTPWPSKNLYDTAVPDITSAKSPR